MRRRLVVLAAAVLAGCPAHTATPPVAAAGPAEVAVVRPSRRAVAREITLPVELRAWQRVAIIAKVSGYVSEVKVDRGTRVKEGDVLARISVPELEDEKAKRLAEVKVAESEAASTRAEHELQKLLFERTQALLADRAVTQTEVDVAAAKVATTAAVASNALAKVEAARKSLASTETWIGYTTVRAPFTGLVAERAVHVGSLVSSAERTLLFDVVDDATIRAAIDVPEVDSLRVVPGETRLRVAITELGGPIVATVTRSAQVLDPKTRTLRVEADLENGQNRLFPGMFGQATLALEVHEKALAIPSPAVARGQHGASAFTLREGKLRRVAIETGLDDGKFVEVLRGLDEGEPVAAVAKGLSDGAPAVAKGEAR